MSGWTDRGVRDDARHTEWCRFVEIFQLAARQVGEVARRFQAHVELEEKSGQSSPQAAALTRTDLAAQDVILLALAEAFPGVAIDAEEETETLSLFPPESPSRPVVVVDPVDGTLNYARGSRDYAVMGAWVEQARYRASVVHFPAERETFWAVAGCGAWRQGWGSSEATRAEMRPAPPLAAVTGTARKPWEAALARLGLEPTRTQCSAVDALAPVLGRARVAVSPGWPSRRRAIGLLITREAGGAVRAGGRPWAGEDPAPVPDGCRPTVVAVNPELARKVDEALGTVK